MRRESLGWAICMASKALPVVIAGIRPAVADRTSAPSTNTGTGTGTEVVVVTARGIGNIHE